MLYIISGKYKGFKINSVSSTKTRSTSHALRKSLFDTIGEFINENIVLDLFAGSGAYGFEALSRNAKQVYLVDNFLPAFKIIKKNIKKLNLQKEQIKLFYNNAFQMLKKFNKENLIFDIIILDPPYFFDSYLLLFSYLEKITNNKSLIIFETHSKTLLPSRQDNFVLFKEKKYGTKKLYYYRKNSFC
jgi:16S rRNA (guanine966-N2)-methyltransferase